MWLAKRDWIIKEPEVIKEGGILQLAELGEKLGRPCRFILEGQEGAHERSYLGFGDGWTLTANDLPGQDPLAALRDFIHNWRETCVPLQEDEKNSVAGLESGLVGYFDYEWGLSWHKPMATEASPRFFFRVCPVNLTWLPQRKRLALEIFGVKREEVARSYQAWEREIDRILKDLTPETRLYKDSEHGRSVAAIDASGLTSEGEGWRGNLSRSAFLEKVERIQEYIKAGDVFQAVLSQRVTLKTKCSDWLAYQHLRRLNPSPYLFYVQGKEETLVGSSPELLVSTAGRRVKTRPIAGTRPRGEDEHSDLANELELRADMKENAEHAMLVDLGRNDLGRVSEYGSVEVSQYAEVERFSHVMHLVSTVEGKLASGQDGLTALKSVFPAGTLSGAPKVRAMEIIQELEPEPRGGYGGALGILRWNGDVDFCITIRTLKFTDTEVSVQAGAGIVYDSLPEREYEETLHKAKALMKVVNDVVDRDR